MVFAKFFVNLAVRIGVQKRRSAGWGDSRSPCTASCFPPTLSQTGLQPHYRRGVWIQGGQRWGEDCQTTDLGHCWPGAISVGSLGSQGGKREGGRERKVCRVPQRSKSKEKLSRAGRWRGWGGRERHTHTEGVRIFSSWRI